MENTQIFGTKISFDKDIFLPIDPKNNKKSYKFKDIEINSKIFKKLSLSQQYICRLINNYDDAVLDIKDNYLSICRTKIKDKYGNYNYDFGIIDYPDYKISDEYQLTRTLSGGKQKLSRKRTNKRSHKRNNRRKYSDKEIIYFYKPGCFYCNEFEPIWNKFTNKNKHIRMRKINGDTHPSMIDKFNVISYPSIYIVTNNKYQLFKKPRTLLNLQKII